MEGRTRMMQQMRQLRHMADVAASNDVSILGQHFSDFAWVCLLPTGSLAEGKIVESSRAFQNLLGRSEHELHGVSFRELFSEHERTQELPEAQNILAASQGESVACAHLTHKSGCLLRLSLLYKRLESKGVAYLSQGTFWAKSLVNAASDGLVMGAPLLVLVFQTAE